MGLAAQATSQTEKANESATTLVTLGLLTDVHYADKPSRGSRYYRESISKVREAAELFKQEQPAALVCMGDVIDAAPDLDVEAQHLKTITEVMDESGIPRHHVLGNHCVTNLTKEEFFKHGNTTTGLGHYSFDLGGVHLIILDACFNKEMESYGRGNFSWADTNIPPEQQDWLAEDLEKANKKSVVFVHQRLDLEPKKTYAVKQSLEIRSILEKSENVLAVFQGHSHKNELKKISGIPYCTLAALVDGSGIENSSYALLDVMSNGQLVLKGYRKQKDRTLEKA